MPIKGLTETRRLERVGKIRLGIKKDNGKGKEYPVAVDYFVCPDAVKEIYGDKPNELPILIPVEDDESWCAQYYKRYSQTRGLICKGDGETCTMLVDSVTGREPNDETKLTVMQEGICDGRDCSEYQKGNCKEMMTLQFLLPEVPGLGVWQIDTGSINAILNINATATLLRGIHRRVAMIPLFLTLEMQKVKSPEGKMRNMPILHLRAKGTLKNMLDEAKGQYALPPAYSLPEPEMGENEVDDLILDFNQAPLGEEPEPEFDDSVEDLAVPKPAKRPAPALKPLKRGSTVTDKGDLMTKATKGLGLPTSEVFEALGVLSIEGIDNDRLQLAWQQLWDLWADKQAEKDL